MENTSDLVYSSDASANRYLYFKDSQDINIFVEDQNKEYEYEEIFKKLLPFANIKTIFSTGGKLAMKERFYEFGVVDPSMPSHPNVFIADGDFDRIIFSKNMIRNEHFIYLDAYNFEDYLLDEIACIRFAMGKLHTSSAATKTILKFSEWYQKIIEQAKKLFITYCFIQSYYPMVPTLNNGAYIFINEKTGFERVGAYKKYKETLLSSHNINIDCEKEKLEAIDKKYQSIYGNDYWHLICGKFLIKSLMCYLGSKGVKHFREDDLRWWLIDHINLENLDYLSEKINKLIEKYKTSEN